MTCDFCGKTVIGRLTHGSHRRKYCGWSCRGKARDARRECRAIEQQLIVIAQQAREQRRRAVA